nr:protein strictosidine synthase-like 6 [Quercus suber]
MDESKNPDSASLPRPSKATFTKQKSSWAFTFLVTVLVPVVAATLLYQLDSFDPAPLPPDELTRHVITVPARNDHMLRVSEFVGVGNLIAPEDVAYDAKSGVIYTGCADGWISRVTVNDSAADSVVEKWVNTGGRPLGIAFGHNNELIVADPEKRGWSLGDYGLTGLVWSLGGYGLAGSGGCGLMPGSRGMGLRGGMGVCSGDYRLTGLVVWSLGGCGLAESGGCGLMPESHGMGLARWWRRGGLPWSDEKGLLNVTANGVVKLLTDEADGQKFKLTDADIFEGKPNGRLLSYDPAIKTTKVLVHNLYFANGVVVSPDQNYVIFCETPMRRCGKYHIQGKEKGRVEKFIDHLPGLPDNIRYDGEGQYWIALATGHTLELDIAFRYPFIRKILIIMEKYIGKPRMEKNGGVLAVDLAGNPIAHYYDPGLALVSSGIKIGNHLYCGSMVLPYIVRLNLKQYPAQATT